MHRALTPVHFPGIKTQNHIAPHIVALRREHRVGLALPDGPGGAVRRR